MNNLNRPKIGLALGSGGARGLAHIGVIQALEEHNIPIDYIAGTSIGAIVGGFYAAGISTAELEKISLRTSWRTMFRLVDPELRLGLIGGEKVKNFIQSQVGDKLIEDCKTPFAAVATNIKTGDIIALKHGRLTEAIRASISIPLVFKPTKIGADLLADGGLSEPVPVETVRRMGADIIIAVNLDQHYYQEEWKPKWIDLANNSLDILRHHLAQLNTANADIAININSGKNYWYQFANAHGNIALGKKATEAILPELNKKITRDSQTGLRKYLKFLIND